MGSIVPADLPRVLTPAAAAAFGLTPGRIRTEVRRGNWQRLAAGVLLTRPDRPSRSDWAAVGIALAPPGAAVTGWDVARLYGVGEHRPPRHPVLVIASRGMNRVVAGVRIARTSRPFRRIVLGANSQNWADLPITTAARAVVDTALLDSDADRVRAIVTASVQRRACRVEDLVAEAALAPRRGGAHLRRALADAVTGARSVAEAHALDRLRHAEVPNFELNVPVCVDGRVVFVVDVLFRALRAVLEIDGREYHFREQDWLATMARHNALVTVGLA
ncbi:MAG: hypothetical protein EPN43_09640, partial [Jatrophihabitans sp.]